jgi:hypothetical protein
LQCDVSDGLEGTFEVTYSLSYIDNKCQANEVAHDFGAKIILLNSFYGNVCQVWLGEVEADVEDVGNKDGAKVPGERPRTCYR